MVKNCDNCKNQNPKSLLQTCNSDGYPLYEECKNWKAKNKQIVNELKNDELARKLLWR